MCFLNYKDQEKYGNAMYFICLKEAVLVDPIEMLLSQLLLLLQSMCLSHVDEESPIGSRKEGNGKRNTDMKMLVLHVHCWTFIPHIVSQNVLDCNKWQILSKNIFLKTLS